MSHWKAAWLTLRFGQNEEAKKQFDEQIGMYPTGNETSAALYYWRARLWPMRERFATGLVTGEWMRWRPWGWNLLCHQTAPRLRLRSPTGGWAAAACHMLALRTAHILTLSGMTEQLFDCVLVARKHEPP